MRKRMVLSMMTVSLLCGGLGAAPPEARPKVRVTFTITEGDIRRDLRGELGRCITTVQDRVRADLQTRFPYFEWVTAGPSAHTLTLSLGPRPTTLDLEHVLVYAASIADGTAPVHVIYPVEDPPGADPLLLRDDVIAKVLEDVVGSEAELKSYFTRHVPLVRRVDIEKRSVLVPVANVHPERGVFVVDFRDEAAKRGKIQLFKPQDQPEGIYCEIQAFQFLPDIPETAWDDQIPAVIKTKARNVEVKVHDFTPRPFANTSGGSVTSLSGDQ